MVSLRQSPRMIMTILIRSLSETRTQESGGFVLVLLEQTAFGVPVARDGLTEFEIVRKNRPTSSPRHLAFSDGRVHVCKALKIGRDRFTPRYPDGQR
jgi:hypothetical protein